MNDALAERCALAILLSALVATIVGLVAWGPIPLDAQAHRYADERVVLGIPGGWNVLANLPLFVAGLLGLHAERRHRAPIWLRRARQGFHAAVALGAIAAGAYHRFPGDVLYLAAQALTAAGFLMLTGALLGERVHPAFASPLVIASAAVAPALAAVLAGAAGAPGPVDLRPLLLLQIVPLLVVPAGALGLPGAQTRTADWLVLLVVYATAQALDLADTTVFQATGTVSGHTLMHLGYAVAAAWLAYCTMARAPAVSATGEASQRSASLHTSR